MLILVGGRSSASSTQSGYVTIAATTARKPHYDMARTFERRHNEKIGKLTQSNQIYKI